MALNWVIVVVRAFVLIFASFVESRICHIYITSGERIWSTVVSRITRGTITSIICIIRRWVTVHYLFVIIICCNSFIRVFRVPHLITWIDLVPADVVSLLYLHIDCVVFATWSAESICVCIWWNWIGFVDNFYVFDDWVGRYFRFCWVTVGILFEWIGYVISFIDYNLLFKIGW